MSYQDHRFRLRSHHLAGVLDAEIEGDFRGRGFVLLSMCWKIEHYHLVASLAKQESDFVPAPLTVPCAMNKDICAHDSFLSQLSYSIHLKPGVYPSAFFDALALLFHRLSLYLADLQSESTPLETEPSGTTSIEVVSACTRRKFTSSSVRQPGFTSGSPTVSIFSVNEQGKL